MEVGPSSYAKIPESPLRFAYGACVRRYLRENQTAKWQLVSDFEIGARKTRGSRRAAALPQPALRAWNIGESRGTLARETLHEGHPFPEVQS